MTIFGLDRSFSPALLLVPQGKSGQSNSSTWLGLDVKAMSEHFQAFTNICNSTETFHSLSKFLVSTAAALSPVTVLSMLSKSFAEVDTMLDGVRLISDIKHAMNLQFVHEFTKQQYAKLCSTISFLVADFGSAVALLGFFHVIDLEKVTMALGKLSAYGHKLPPFVIKVVTGAVSLQIQTGAFFFLGVHTVVDIAMKGSDKHKLVTLANCTSEVAHKGFVYMCAPLLSPVVYVASAGALGMVANGFGIWNTYNDVFCTHNKKSA